MAWQEVKVKVKTAMNSAEQVASMIQPVGDSVLNLKTTHSYKFKT